MLDLTGSWSLADAERQFTAPITLPGDVHSALQAAGLIPDPCHGRNEYALRWVAERDWTLSRSFSLPDVPGPWTLVVDGLDTVAEVRLNGTPALQAATAFREHRAEVADALRPGENTIEIVIRSSPRAANALRAAQPFPIPYSASNCPIPNGNMLRKPQRDCGWDWNIALAPLGAYGRIALLGPGGEIGTPRIRQQHENGMAKRFFAPVTVVGIPDGEGGFRLIGMNDTAAPAMIGVDISRVAVSGATRAVSMVHDGSGSYAEVPPDTAVELELDLPDPKLSLETRVEGDTLVATVTARTLARFVTPEADRPGRFSDNAFLLDKWSSKREIDFIPAAGDPGDVTLTHRDLYSSYA